MLAFFNVYCRRPIVVLALAALAGTAHAQMGLGLSPMRIDVNLAPGAVQSGVLTLSNSGAALVRAVGETLDFYIDSTATPQFAREYRQEAEFSCRPWLSANPMEVEMNAQATLQVRYTLRVPQTATPRSYHCALGFTTQTPATDGRGMGLRSNVRIVAAIYVVVGKPVLEGGVKDLKLEYVPDPKTPGWRAVVTINNPGLMHFRAQGEIDVLDQSGAVVETAKFIPIPVLPKRDQNFLFPLKLAQGEGKYTLRARVDIGGNEIQEATASVVAAKSKL